MPLSITSLRAAGSADGHFHHWNRWRHGVLGPASSTVESRSARHDLLTEFSTSRYGGSHRICVF